MKTKKILVLQKRENPTKFEDSSRPARQNDFIFYDNYRDYNKKNKNSLSTCARAVLQ